MKKLRPICTLDGYFDHYYFFTTMVDNAQEAFEMTENIIRSNFFIYYYKDYEVFRQARYKYQKGQRNPRSANKAKPETPKII